MIAFLIAFTPSSAQQPVLDTERPAGQPPAAGLLSPASEQSPSAPIGYLPNETVPDTFKILPPPPKSSSPARSEDEAAYRETRKLQGAPRWALASDDAVLTPLSLLADESCAMNVSLGPANAPELVKLLTRVGRDSSQIVNKAKDQFKQLRPFVVEGGPICTESDRQGIAKSYSYPSGHSTYSWAASLILAELAPERATPILARGRAYGESRVVCGVHWVSDVEEGRTNASILVAVLHSNPAFMADLAEAKLEVASAYAAGGSSHIIPANRCAAEAAAAAHTPWTR